MLLRPALVLSLFLTGAAVAHQGVTNPAVMARMEGMSRINEAMKVLSSMVKGERAFDVSVASEARSAVLQQTRAIPSLFAAEESDPKSEAREAIWSDPVGFAENAAEALSAAEALDVSSLASLQSGFTRVGLSCKGCHDEYRTRK